MRHWTRFLLGFLSLLAMPMATWAQAPAPTPGPAPAPTPSLVEKADIESLREPGSTAKLFPQDTPAPLIPGTPDEPGVGGTVNGRRGNALLNSGQRRRSTRANDLLGDLADSDPLELRVAYRRAKTTAMARDPGLADLLRSAAAADTDVHKRAFLKEYYTRLYADVRKVNPSPEMQKHVELLGLVAQQRYDPQRRVVGGEEDLIRGGGGRRGRAR